MSHDRPEIDIERTPRRLRIQRGFCVALLPLFLLPAIVGVLGASASDEPADAAAVATAVGPTSDTVPSASSGTAAGTGTTSSTTDAEVTTTTAAAPSTVAPTTTRAAKVEQAVRAVARPRVTATTAPVPATTVARSIPPTTTAPPPPPPTTAAPAPPARSDRGQATWYRWKAGNCAHNTLPKGTVVTVTAVATGRSTTCTVGDRGAFRRPTVIDLDATVFARIAPLGSGRIEVVLSW